MRRPRALFYRRPHIGAAALAVAATFLSGPARAADCPEAGRKPGLTTFYSDAWGIDARNTRFQPPERTRLSAANVERLELKWAYGFANGKPRSFPLVTEDTIFIGDTGRGLVALDRETGCVRWEHKHKGEIGSAILHEAAGDRVRLFFASRSKGLVAVDAADGTLLWKSTPSAAGNPVPMFSGTPLVQEGAIYVPISSQEIGLPINPFYGCCTTSGAIAALDSATGEQRWYLKTIREPPKITGRHFLLVEERGPSGAPVWGAPTLDAAHGLLYFGTGQNYSRPATGTSDAIIAVDAREGTIRWVRQFTADDAFNVACGFGGREHPNCPRPMGPDVDFGAPPVLAHLPDGRKVLIAGQKSGGVYAMSPDDGAVLWKRRIGRGGALGGIHWGLAVNEALGLVFVPVSDISQGDPAIARAPGIHALDLATGAVRWSHLREARCPDRSCWGGISAAITATADLVFAGSINGFLEALDARTGKLLWSHDSWQNYPSVNGVKAAGGAFDAHGPMVADDLVIVSSGYAGFAERAGNALLVFKLKEGGSP